MIRIADPAQLATAIRDLRRNRNLTQAALAAQAQFDSSQICNWERGRRVPEASTLIRLADALGYDLALVPREDA